MPEFRCPQRAMLEKLFSRPYALCAPLSPQRRPKPAPPNAPQCRR